MIYHYGIQFLYFLFIDMENISAWYKEQYINGVGLNNLDGSNKFKKLCKSFPVDMSENKLPLSGQTLMGTFISTKVMYPIAKNGYICTMMSCKIKNITINYAFAYWRNIEDEIPEYICVSPTFESQDGEFRRRFMIGSRYLKFIDEFTEYIEPYEIAIIEMISKILDLDVFIYPESDIISSKVDNLRLPITALVVALILDLQDFHQNRLMMHVNNNYKTFLNIVKELYPHLLEIKNNNKFRRIINSDDDDGIQCGQKLVPMFVKETTNIITDNIVDTTINNLKPVKVIKKRVIKLQPDEVAVYDYLKGCELIGDYKGLRKGLNWFMNNNSEAYMVLLD